MTVSARYSLFEVNLSRASDLVGLGRSLGSMTRGLVDGSDLYRSAIVQTVAALDHYIHGIVLDRGVSILLGRTSPGASTRFGLPFNAVSEILNVTTESEAELTARKHLAQRLGLETYQKPDDIAKALSMVGVGKVWSEAFSDPGAAKTRLNLVVNRRNMVVHQCDSDPLMPGQVTPLDYDDALNSISCVREIVDRIDPICRL